MTHLFLERIGARYNHLALPRPWVANLLWSLAAFALPVAIYLRALAPTVYALDSAELTTGAYTLGIVHAPGSPLYLLIGHFFTLLPIGDVGYRTNLLSALAAAVGALFVYQILVHLTRQRFVSLFATWFLGFSYYFWTSAVVAEHYPLAACLLAALLWLVLKWRDDGKPVQFYALALFYGLALGAHLSLILLAPGFFWLAITAPSQPGRQLRLVVKGSLFLLLGASIYLYLPIRYLSDTPLNYARDYWHVNIASWDGFWWMVTGRMFASLFFAVPPSDLPSALITYVHRLSSNFLGLGLLVGFVGWTVDFKRLWQLQLGLGLMFIAHLAFYIPYRAINVEVMLLPSYLIWGIWVGLGFQTLGGYIRKLGREYEILVPSLLVLLVLSALLINFRYADMSQDTSARTLGEEIMGAIEPNAYYFGTWADVPILEYLQMVERQRPDVTTVNLVFTGKEIGAKIALDKFRSGYPVYASLDWIASDDLALEESGVCPCYRALPPAPSSAGRQK